MFAIRLQHKAYGPEAKARLGLYSAFFLAPLLPEYLAPFTTLAGFYYTLIYLRSKGKKITFSAGHYPVIAFLVWQFIGILGSDNKADSLVFSLLWLFMFLGFVFTSNLIDREDLLEKIFFIITLGAGLCGVIGVGQIFLLHFGHYISPALTTFFNPFWGTLDVFLAKGAVKYLLPANLSQMLPHREPVQFVERASATFTNPLFFSSWLVMALPFASYCLFYSKGKRKRLICLMSIVGIIGGIAASYSRAPYLATVVTVFIMLFFGWRQALTILSITPMFLLIFPSGVYRRLRAILDFNDYSITTRGDIWAACSQTLREKWLWGLGPGVDNIRQILIKQYGIFQPHAHNLFLQLYLEGGIVGGSLFSLIIVWLFVDIITIYTRSKQSRPIAVTFFASLIGFLVCGLTDYVLYGPKILQFFMLFMGLVHAAKRIYLPKSDKAQTL